MSEFGINLRDQQATQFKGQSFQQLGNTYRDYAVDDFISSGIQNGTIIEPMNNQIVEGDDLTDKPVAWRLVVPVPQVAGVTSIEFGTAIPGIMNIDESRFSNEMHFDHDIDAHAEHPAVKELFSRVGGDLVNLIKRDGEILFSGLERVVRDNPDGSSVLWNRLAYSHKLLTTSKLLDKHIDGLRSKGTVVPEWLFSASLARNRRSTAAAMAMSGLYALRSQ